MPFLFQSGNEIWLSALWYLFLIFIIFFYPKLMVYQILWKLEKSAITIENLTLKAKRIVIKKIAKRPEKELREKINNFMEFFIIEPVNLDPFGIVKKIEHIMDLSQKKFKSFAKEVAPNLDEEEQANFMMGMSGAISLYQIAKIVRHYVELIKKTKNYQLGVVIDMQMPLVERISNSLLRGTEALTNGWPIGDSIGPLIAAKLIGNTKAKETEDEVVVVNKKIKGRNVIIMKAKGPGGRLGKLGKAVEKILKRKKVSKIITIDAAAKLEGEKTGTVAEGVGVAIGGIGVDRAYIENISAKKKIPLDSIVIKMSQEEAFEPMPKPVLNSVPIAVKAVERSIEGSKLTVLVVGVGNCSGVGNNAKAAEKAEEQAKKVWKIMEARKMKEKKGLFKLD